MNIQSTPNLTNVRPSLRTAMPNPAQKTGGQEALSTDEKQLIGTQFKAPSPRVLELYAANGTTITEQPQAKGNNIDFTV